MEATAAAVQHPIISSIFLPRPPCPPARPCAMCLVPVIHTTHRIFDFRAPSSTRTRVPSAHLPPSTRRLFLPSTPRRPSTDIYYPVAAPPEHHSGKSNQMPTQILFAFCIRLTKINSQSGSRIPGPGYRVSAPGPWIWQIVQEIYVGTTPTSGPASDCLSSANAGQYFAVKGEFISTARGLHLQFGVSSSRAGQGCQVGIMFWDFSAKCINIGLVSNPFCLSNNPSPQRYLR